MNTPLPITLGDPNGLGPELACRFFQNWTTSAQGQRPLLLLGPETALLAHARRRGVAPFWLRVSKQEALAPSETRDPLRLLVPEGLEDYAPEIGRATLASGRAAGLSLGLACELMHRELERGATPGLVTLPLHKKSLIDAGFNFPGHTEFLAQRFGLAPDQVCMHLCGDILRVSLVTTHPPLAQVASLITQEKIVRCLLLTSEFLQGIGKDTAPIAVCGLNPHAGEEGKIGREEIETIQPAIATARGMRVDAVGPFPADSLFHRAARGEFAAVLAMYHDQGLAPLKLLHFGNAVNVTLGLPVVRTSVDHGTGFDLVGRDVADCGSLAAALELAQKLVLHRNAKD
jgi:4-hydroxythreonine-4-phosphate dehydrogenase